MKLLRCALLVWTAALATASAQPYVVNTMAGHGKLGYAGDGKAANTVNFFTPKRVAFDRAGNLYFTEGYYHRVFKVGTNGTLTTIAGNGGTDFAGEGGAATAAALPNPAGIAVGADGTVYVGTSSRLCTISNGRVRTIAGTGDQGYTGDRGPALSAKIHTPEGIALDNAGNIYFSDVQSSVVRRIGTDGIITTVAGTGTPGYSGEGPATTAQLNGPEGLAFDSNGNLYIADRYNNRVRKVAPDGTISTFAGTGEPGTGGSTGSAREAQLHQPEGVAVDAANNVFIADTSNGKLKMVAPSGAITIFIISTSSMSSISDVAVNPAGGVAATDFLLHVVNRIVWDSSTIAVSVTAGVVRSAALGDGGKAADATFIDPWGITADPSGNWYVADNGDQRVRRIALNQVITTVAGTGVFGASEDGPDATLAKIAQPRALAADFNGNIYFNSACVIRVLLRNGALKTVAGNGTCGYRADPIAAVDAQFQFPKGLAIDSSGSMLYIADTDNNRIRRLDLGAGTVTTIAGNGQRGYAGNGTDALQAKVDSPLGLAVDAQGNVYFADENNHRVRKITAGIISDFAGTGVCADVNDGPATSSPLCYPSGVAVDAAGNVYIADSGYIRRVGPDGRLTTIAGNGSLGMTGEGEPATETGISPFYVALDGKGRVCFSDRTNIRIRCLDAAPKRTVTVVNGATFLAGSVAPGEIVTISGTGMGPASLVSASLDPAGPPLATTLADVQIAFDGIAAPLLYVSATQSSAIVPFGVSGKTSTTVQVTYQGKPAGSATLSVATASPGLFTMASNGSGQGAILNQDYSVNSAARPAARGEVVMLFGTGGGITSPPSGDGQFTSGTPTIASKVVTIGGADAIVQYAGAAPGMVAGVFQINVYVPDAAPSGDKVPIVVTAGAGSSPATVTVAVK